MTEFNDGQWSETMAEQNEGTTEQLEEVSGRWLRDQLRDVAETPPANVAPPPPPAPAGDSSSAQLIEGLAASISAAVVEPIRGLESRREARQAKVEESLHQLAARLDGGLGEIARIRDQAAAALTEAQQTKAEAKREIEAVRAQARADVEALASEAKNEIEAIRAKGRQDLDSMAAATAELRGSFHTLAEEIGRLQEKVREQHERINALLFRETQRAKAMGELVKASTALREAVSAAAALAAPAEATGDSGT